MNLQPTEEVKEEVSQAVTPIKKAKKRRGPDSCECETVPSPKQFSLSTVKKDAMLVGTYCTNCYSILAWGRVENEAHVKEIKVKEPKEEKPKAVKKEKAAKVVAMVPETASYEPTTETNTPPVITDTAIAMTPAEISNEVAMQEATLEATMATVTVTDVAVVDEAKPVTVQTGLFAIVGVNPVDKKPDHMSFLCVANGQPFNVIIESTKEKVSANINTPGRVVGKMAELEYAYLDSRGIPQYPKILAVKPKEVPQTA